MKASGIVPSDPELLTKGCGIMSFDPSKNRDTITSVTAEPTLNETITWVILATTALTGFIWAATHDQFTDLDRAARLPLEDEEEELHR